MYRLLYKRSVVVVLTQRVVLSDGNSLVLRVRCADVENLNSNHTMNGLYFEGIYNTMKREVMRSDKKWCGKTRMQLGDSL